MNQHTIKTITINLRILNCVRIVFRIYFKYDLRVHRNNCDGIFHIKLPNKIIVFLSYLINVRLYSILILSLYNKYFVKLFIIDLILLNPNLIFRSPLFRKHCTKYRKYNEVSLCFPFETYASLNFSDCGLFRKRLTSSSQFASRIYLSCTQHPYFKLRLFINPYPPLDGNGKIYTPNLVNSNNELQNRTF